MKQELWQQVDREISLNDCEVFSFSPDLSQNSGPFGELGKQKDYRDGLLSDLKLNMDPQEEDIESQSQISYLGTNQRFGRKFKIVRFRWLRANEV